MLLALFVKAAAHVDELAPVSERPRAADHSGGVDFAGRAGLKPSGTSDGATTMSL
jgi:hypothetical protein